MPRTIRTRFFYPVGAERLWALATSYDGLSRVTEGIVAFEGLPDGRTRTGQSIDVDVSLFGKLPKQAYHMDVLECDDAEMILRSVEKGAGVKSWRHTLSITPYEGGSVLTDTIEIEAGLLTPLFAAWARYLYNARHQPRLRLLESDAF